MRELNLTPYEVEERGQKIPYDIKQSVIAILFHADLKLNAVELLEANKLAEKVYDADEAILLEEADYDRIKRAVNAIKGYTKDDVEFVRRVLECPTVNVRKDGA